MPPHLPFVLFATLWLWMPAIPGLAQPQLFLFGSGSPDSIVVNGFTDPDGSGNYVVQGEWHNVDRGEASFDMRWPAQDAPAVDLAELVVAGIDQYLDQRIRFTRDGVKAALPMPLLNAGMQRMVDLAVNKANAGPVHISEASQRQLARVASIDWSQAKFGIDGADDQEKYLAIYYYVHAQRQELERALRNDLAPLAGVAIRAPAAKPGPVDTEAPTICSTVFDEDRFLCALDLGIDTATEMQDVKLTDDVLREIAARTAAPPVPAMAQTRIRKRDRWLKSELDAINSRIDQLDQRKELWVLRDRLDDLEGRLDDLSLQMDELEQQHTAAPGAAGMIGGRNLQVQFGVGQAVLDASARAVLNEVARSLRQTPHDRVLVTGHTDPTGPAALNLALAERRAKAVRDYLIGQGIGAQRVLLNYGAAPTDGPAGAAGRRAEVEWIR